MKIIFFLPFLKILQIREHAEDKKRKKERPGSIRVQPTSPIHLWYSKNPILFKIPSPSLGVVHNTSSSNNVLRSFPAFKKTYRIYSLDSAVLQHHGAVIFEKRCHFYASNVKINVVLFIIIIKKINNQMYTLPIYTTTIALFLQS